MKKIILVLLVFSIIILLSCSKTTESDNTPPTVVITYPANNSEFIEGTDVTVIADANDNEGIDKVEFYIDGTKESTDTTEPYEYVWDTGNKKNTIHTIYAKAYDTSTNSTSSSVINVTITDIPFITVNSPNGGETWQMGSTYEITWNDNISENVKIELYKSGSFNRTIKSSTASDGSYSWPIPTDLTESSSYKVKVTSTNNSSVNDQSNNYFTIEEEPSADYITVTSPNGGETWQMGSTHNITWNDNISENVKIELYKSGSFNRTIKSTTESDGSYDWNIPTDLTESSSYKIKITSTSNSSVHDYSDSYFTIQQGGGTGTVTDIDGNVYQTIIIGDQEWMMENLKVTHYRNGDPIPHLTNNDDWTSTSSGAYCYYNNSSANGDTYGALYNWYAVNDSRGIAPEGWHVPTDDDWKELEMYLGMTQAQADDTGWRGTNEGSKLAGNSDLWNNGALENNAEFGTSGFSSLPGGYRSSYYGDGTFHHIGNDAHFWSSSEYSSGYAWLRTLLYVYSEVGRYVSYKWCGFSVRCIRSVE